MTINLGIYDFFAYIIPGLLYLFLINSFFQRLGWASFDFIQSNIPISIGTIGAVALAAYVLGHLFDVFARWFCYQLLTPKELSASVLEDIKKNYADLDIQYNPKDYHLLFVMLRQRNFQHAQVMDRFEANSIMLENVSFAAFLFFLVKLSELFTRFDITSLVICLGMLLICFLAYRSSKIYHTWFFLDVFEASLEYGKNVKEVLGHPKQK
jgi:hypothetical protein